MDKIVEALSKADWTVLLTIILGLAAWGIAELFKSKKILVNIDALKKQVLETNENLRTEIKKEISTKHKYFGSDVSGKYKNLGEQIGDEHNEINKNAKNVYDMMSNEKQNRELLYNNSAQAKEILDTIDVMREVVDQNARLNHEVYVLRTENQGLLNEKHNSAAIEELSATLRDFKRTLSEFDTLSETEEIRVYLEKIRTQLSGYVD